MKYIGKNKFLLSLVFIITSGLSVSAFAATGFLSGERISGMNKICYYKVLGSTYTLNIKRHQNCPITHEF